MYVFSWSIKSQTNKQTNRFSNEEILCLCIVQDGKSETRTLTYFFELESTK